MEVTYNFSTVKQMEKAYMGMKFVFDTGTLLVHVGNICTLLFSKGTNKLTITQSNGSSIIFDNINEVQAKQVEDMCNNYELNRCVPDSSGCQFSDDVIWKAVGSIDRCRHT